MTAIGGDADRSTFAATAEPSKVSMRVSILAVKAANTVEMTIDQPLPRVPAWIRLQTFGERPRFWTLPPGHFLERTEARYGYPRAIVETSRRFLAGEIDQAAAEAAFHKALTGWSESTA